MRSVDIMPLWCLQFASVGEDSSVNVWSLPELGSSGKMKVTLDMSSKFSDTVFTGVQFLKLGSRGVHHLLCSIYDAHALRVFLGL